MPGEVVGAAGLRPTRVVPQARPSDADTHIHPTTCPYIKSHFASVSSGLVDGAGGVVIVNSCDGMRRLFDALVALPPGDRTLFLDVPTKKDDAAVDFFAAELGRFAEALVVEFSGSPVTPDSLARSIGAHNAVRRLMQRLFALQKEADSAISGADVFSIIGLATETPVDELPDRLSTIIGDLEKKRDGTKKKRIVISANVFNRPDLIEMIEGAGARVVALDTCFGERHFETPVAEGSDDPMRAIAHRYLTRTGCPRMDGIGARVDYLTNLATAARADGVVMSTVKYCDSWLYEAPFTKERLEAAKIPVLPLENDYEWSGLSQMRTRVEAFVETIG
jgi:benzoyl-CoA reductase/2-hydroxyglutaryl-CoA dehydratase subunit BcrC/BadD/HgdB